MKKEKISEAIGNIDEKYVAEAAEYVARPSSFRKNLLRWGSVAACLCLAAVIAVNVIPVGDRDKDTVVPGFTEGAGDLPEGTEAVGDITMIPGSSVDEMDLSVSFGQLHRPYGDDNVMGEESAIVFPWEYLSTMERFGNMEFDGQAYMSKYSTVAEDRVGERIGNCTATGREYPFDSDGVILHDATFEVYAIKDIPENNLVAVRMDGEYVVFIRAHLREEYDYIKNLGELFDIFNLSETVTLSRFTEMQGFEPLGYFTTDRGDLIWDILSECRDAPASDGTESRYDSYLSFTVTSDALGIYKKAMYISRDGYMWTNLNEWGYEYFIGASAAEKIIVAATENAAETEYEPYRYYLSGTVTEVGDGYILVDDSVRCADETEGAVFRVITVDICLSRIIDYVGIKAGDIVMVTFDGLVNVKDGFVIEGATDISPARLIDGDVLVEE